jgi:hypothetical protein
MTIREAKDLHSDITKLLLALHEIRNAAEATESDEVQTIEITGGDFK